MTSPSSPPIATIDRPPPSAVTYHIRTTPTPTPLQTTIHLPPASTWTSGLHFHATHTEYLHLVRGSIRVRLGSTTHIVSAAAGGIVDSNGTLQTAGLTLEVPRYTRHDWGRADTSAVPYASEVVDLHDEVIVEEWTVPTSISKPLFFHNLNGAILGPPPSTTLARATRWALGPWWIPFQLFIIFYTLDNYPVFVSLENRASRWVGARIGRQLEHGVEYAMSISVLFVASVVGSMLGVSAVSEERTPPALWKAWQLETAGRGKKDN